MLMLIGLAFNKAITIAYTTIVIMMLMLIYYALQALAA